MVTIIPHSTHQQHRYLHALLSCLHLNLCPHICSQSVLITFFHSSLTYSRILPQQFLPWPCLASPIFFSIFYWNSSISIQKYCYIAFLSSWKKIKNKYLLVSLTSLQITNLFVCSPFLQSPCKSYLYSLSPILPLLFSLKFIPINPLPTPLHWNCSHRGHWGPLHCSICPHLSWLFRGTWVAQWTDSWFWPRSWSHRIKQGSNHPSLEFSLCVSLSLKINKLKLTLQ